MTNPKYGAAHQKLRAAWKVQVEAGGIHCHRCSEPIIPGTRWHLDHHDNGTGSSPSHARCNVATSKIWRDKAMHLEHQIRGESTLTWFD